jgi:phosphate transport system substrate-binding protein
MAEIVTSAGPSPVTITADTVGKTIAGAKFRGQGNDLVVDTSSFYNPAQSGSYPIVLVTYEIVCSKGLPGDKTALVKAFLTHFASPEVQSSLEGLQYAPLPDEVRSKVQAAIQAIS